MKRPLTVTLISALYIVTGIVAIIYHAREWAASLQGDDLLAFVIRVLAIVGGVFALRGQNWARWLLVLWIGYHIVLSVGHPVEQIITHALFGILTGVCLFNKKANGFFRRSGN